MTPGEPILNSPSFIRAVSGIQRRAERQTDLAVLGQLFVRSDLFERVQSPDSQLILGRRGTGKTHLVRAFQEHAASHGEPTFYLDCTRLGSGYTSLELPAAVVAQKYFLALVNQLGTDLMDEALRLERPDPAVQMSVLKKLIDGLATTLEVAPNPATAPTFNYRQISDIIGQVLEQLKMPRVYVVLDEWAQVPLESQPFFAEYIKRGILTVPSVSLKILAVNYQCQLSRRQNGNLIGLERGADIPDVIDLDRYLIYDEKQRFVIDFFGQVLYNHLGNELAWPLELAPDDKRKFIVTRLFTQERAFVELVRAAEGNSRDLLCIFARAFFDEFRRAGTAGAISIPNVTAAATSWYDSEKAANVLAEPEAHHTLTHIMDRVLKGYKSRTFLVESSKAENSRLIRLLNERVLHRLNGTYSHPDRPGVRYDLFTVDYGAYARLRATVNQVQEDVFWELDAQKHLSPEQQQSMVPVDDRRSIRRITFDPDSLEVVGERVDPQLWLRGM
ncbi:MAG: AAA family ATPase [Pirellulales bacterium]